MTSSRNPLFRLLHEAIARQVDARVLDDDTASPQALRTLAQRLDPMDERHPQIDRALRTLREIYAKVQATRDAPSASDGTELRRISLQARDESLDSQLRSLRDRLRSIADVLGSADQRTQEASRIGREAFQQGVQAVDILSPIRPSPQTPRARSASPAPPRLETCTVPDCDRSVKARSLCSRHYGQWYRGSLDGWVQANGVVRFSDGSRWQVGEEWAAEPATRDGDAIHIGRREVEARPLR